MKKEFQKPAEKTDAKGGSDRLFVAARFLTVLLDLLPGIVLARILDKHEYGTFLQCFLVLQSFSVVLTFGIPRGIVFFGASSHDRRNDTLNCLLLMSVVILTGASPLLIAPQHLARLFQNPDLAPIFGLLYLSLFLRTINIAAPFIFISLEKVRAVSLLTMGKSLLGFVLIVGTCWLAPHVRSLISAYTLAEAALTVYMVVFIARMKSPRPLSLDWALWGKVFRYSLPLALGSLVMVLSNRLDQYMISFLFTPADFATYARGAMEIPVTSVLTISLSNLIAPKLAKHFQTGDRAAFVAVWHSAIKKVIFVSYPLFVYFEVFSKPFITFLYTDQYAASSQVFCVYLLLILLQFSSLDAVLQSVGLTKSFFWVSLMTVGVNLGASMFLIHVISYVGPAVGLALALLVSTCAYLTLIRKALGIGWGDLLPWGAFGRMVLCNAFLGASLFAFKSLVPIPNKFIQLVSGGILASLLYVALLVGFGWITLESTPIRLGRKRVNVLLPRLAKDVFGNL